MLIFEVVNNPQVSRDAETGISRGCGFVMMRSLAEARTAINALDGFVSHTIGSIFSVVSSQLAYCLQMKVFRVVIQLRITLFYFHVSLIGPGWA